MKRQILCFICIICLFIFFTFNVFAVDYDDPYSYYLGPSFPSNKDNIINWTHIGSSTLSITAGQNLHIEGSIGDKDLFYAPIWGVVAGKTYVVQGLLAFASTSNRLKVEINISADSENRWSDTFTTDDPNYYAIDDTTSNNAQRFSYTFKPSFSQIASNNALHPSYGYFTNMVVQTTLKNTAANFAFKQLNIVCLDDIAHRALMTIIDETDELEEMTQIIVDYLFEMLYDDTQSNNISEMTLNQYEFFRWMWQHYPNSVHSDFYRQFNGDFFILLYNLLNGALSGETTVYETDTAFNNAADEFESAEAAVLGDPDDAVSDVGAVMASADPASAFAGNGAFSFIRNTLNAIVFENTKLSVFVVFGLGMGIVVLVLGRKLHV